VGVQGNQDFCLASENLERGERTGLGSKKTGGSICFSTRVQKKKIVKPLKGQHVNSSLNGGFVQDMGKGGVIELSATGFKYFIRCDSGAGKPLSL